MTSSGMQLNRDLGHQHIRKKKPLLVCCLVSDAFFFFFLYYDPATSHSLQLYLAEAKKKKRKKPFYYVASGTGLFGEVSRSFFFFNVRKCYITIKWNVVISDIFFCVCVSEYSFIWTVQDSNLKFGLNYWYNLFVESGLILFLSLIDRGEKVNIRHSL